MSNLKILLKNNFNQLLGRLQGKKKRVSTSVALVLLVLGMVGILALYSFQAWSMFEGLKLGKLCVFHAIITTLTVLLIIGIMRVTGKTKGNDADFLLSLPIKKRDIIISKLVNKYLFDLFFSVIMLLPYIVIYEITAPAFSANVLIFGIIVTLFLPLLSVGISEIMEFIVVKLFNRIKFGNVLKSLVPTLIYILLLVLMLIKTSGYGKVQFDSMEAYFADRWLANQILAFIFDQSLVSIIVFVCLTLVPVVIGTLLYINIYGKNFGVYTSAKKEIVLKPMQSPFTHLVNKEIKSYFATPAYLVNTIIGPIFIIVVSIVSAIWGIGGILSSLQISYIENELPYLFVLVVNLCVAMTCISCVSISLDGKTFWFLRALPLSANQVFMSKLMVSLVVITPVLVVSSVIAGIMFNSLISGLIVFGITMIFLLINDVSGLLINLWLPKLDWENETQVVKQSLSVLLAMVFNSVIAVIPIAIYLVIRSSLRL
ncbi:MAG: hypothetical protein J5689_00860 [Clostridia bacterium]|nr:hypothetical protein [Clostridia bacterium]